MAHFAEIDKDNVVQRVIVVSDRNTSDSEGNENEDIGVAYCRTLYGSDTNWKKCSYNMSFRKAFPGPGYVYVESVDAFAIPQPHPSWTLNENAQWQPPIEKPSLTESQENLLYHYFWNEKLYQDDTNNPKTQGWVLFTPQIITIDTQPTNVTVSAGSSATFTSSATVNKGYFGYILHKVDGDQVIDSIPSSTGNNEESEALTLNAICHTGITTSGDNNTQWKIEFIPRDLGVTAFTTSVTLTVE